MEEAKIRRQPPEKELSRQICLGSWGGNGVGRESAFSRFSAARMCWPTKILKLQDRITEELKKSVQRHGHRHRIDIRDRESIRQALRESSLRTVAWHHRQHRRYFPFIAGWLINDGQWASH